MIFSSKATPQWMSAVAGLLAALSLAGLLAACGGGTSQYDPFVPNRLLVFGDENSSIEANGRKYTVNALDTSGAINCQGNALWVQSVASYYGFTFAECNPTFVAQTQARMLALPGAKVADVAAQVEAQVAAGGFRDKDLGTMLAGGNDLLELYALSSARSQDSLLAEARVRGQRLAAVVNRLVALGVKVIVSDVPDLGLTPYAAAQNSLGNDGAFLSRLTTAFNEQLGANLLLDGRYIGLVQAQLQFQAIGRSPGTFGYTNINTGLCTIALPDCTTATLITGGNVSQYLWADDSRFSPAAHAALGQLAVDRARRNPF